MTNKKQLGGSADYQGCNRWEELLTSKQQLGGSAYYQKCNRWEELLTNKKQLGGSADYQGCNRWDEQQRADWEKHSASRGAVFTHSVTRKSKPSIHLGQDPT